MRPALFALLLLVPAIARADGPRQVDTTYAVKPAGELTVEAALVTGFPAALPTGLARGLGAGVTFGGMLAWGAHLSWATASESSAAWDVTHRDLRARITGSVRHIAGRGTVGLRFGAGATLVNEVRRRHQGARAGLTGDMLETSAWAMLPGATAEAVIALRIRGPWALVVSGGPAVNFEGDKPRAGWCAELGVSWQP